MPTVSETVMQADKLLSPEFQPVLEQLVNHCARKRQICLFSATFPVTVKDFKDRHISNPYEINLMEELTLKVIPRLASALSYVARQSLSARCSPFNRGGFLRVPCTAN